MRAHRTGLLWILLPHVPFEDSFYSSARTVCVYKAEPTWPVEVKQRYLWYSGFMRESLVKAVRQLALIHSIALHIVLLPHVYSDHFVGMQFFTRLRTLCIGLWIYMLQAFTSRFHLRRINIDDVAVAAHSYAVFEVYEDPTEDGSPQVRFLEATDAHLAITIQLRSIRRFPNVGPLIQLRHLEEILQELEKTGAPLSLPPLLDLPSQRVGYVDEDDDDLSGLDTDERLSDGDYIEELCAVLQFCGADRNDLDGSSACTAVLRDAKALLSDFGLCAESTCKAFQLAPQCIMHLKESDSLAKLGRLALKRAAFSGKRRDFDIAVESLEKEWMHLCEQCAGSEKEVSSNLNLCVARIERQKRFRYDFVGDLDIVIDEFNHDDHAPPGMPSSTTLRRRRLLGAAYQARFEVRHDIEDLEKAITFRREIAREDKARFDDFHNLAFSLDTRIKAKHYAVPRHDFDEAAEAHREACEMNPTHGALLVYRGRSSFFRFQMFRDESLVDEAIELMRQGLEETDSRTRMYAVRLQELALTLWEHPLRGDAENGEILQSLEDAAGHPSMLHNPIDQANALHNLSLFLLELADDAQPQGSKTDFIHRSLEVRKECLRLHRTAESLHALGDALFSSLGGSKSGAHPDSLAVLDRSIRAQEDAIDLAIEEGQLPLAYWYVLLGRTYATRAEALEASSSDLDVTGREQPDGVSSQDTLHLCLASEDEHDSAICGRHDFHRALFQYHHAAGLPYASPVDRMMALQSLAQLWANGSRVAQPNQPNHRRPKFALEKAVEYFERCIDLLPSVAWIGLDDSSKLNEIKRVHPSIGTNAAACALELAALETDSSKQEGYRNLAITFLDRSSFIVWSQYAALRTKLPTTVQDDDVAKRLEGLTKYLYSTASGRNPRAQDSDEIDVKDRQAAAEEWQKLVEDIRNPYDPGFLQPPKLSKASLDLAAHESAIIAVMISELACYALVIQEGNVPLSIELSGQDKQHIDSISTSTAKSIAAVVSGSTKVNVDELMTEYLHLLWEEITLPVLEALGAKLETSNDPVAIRWWISGAPYLPPLHAARPRPGAAGGQHDALDLLVSSYIFNISSLSRETATSNSEASKEKKDSKHLRALVVGMALDPDESKKAQKDPKDVAVLRRIASNASNDNGFTFLTNATGTVQSVVDSLATSTWAHFSCHGFQETRRPTDSALVLHNGSALSISAIAQVPWAARGVAVLLACESGTGSAAHMNEGMHLAGAFQTIGFRGVIASLWPMADECAVPFTEAVYGEMFGGYPERGPDAARSATAVRAAVLRLRDMQYRGGKLPVFVWLPFVHFG